MKLNYKAALITLAVALATTNCKKETKSTDPPPTTPPASTVNNIVDLFAQNGIQVKSSTASATTSQTITVSGVVLNIPPNAFLTAVGGTVTGNVTVTTKGIFTKSDIILSGAPANSNSSSRLVGTKGCIKVSASQSGQTLRIAPGNTFYVNVPELGTPVNNLRKYYSNKISATDSTLAWKIDPDSVNIPVIFDTLNAKYYYQVRIDSANWLNCGRIWDTVAPKTSVTVNVNTMFNKTNTAIYVSLNGIIVVGAMFEVSPGVFRISNIPVGRAVNIVGVTVINGQYYSAILPATITPGFNQPLNLQTTTLSQIQTQLNALP